MLAHRDSGAEARAQEARSAPRREIPLRPPACVIAMRVRDHGALHRARGVDEKIAGLAVEALFAEHQHEANLTPTETRKRAIATERQYFMLSYWKV